MGISSGHPACTDRIMCLSVRPLSVGIVILSVQSLKPLTFISLLHLYLKIITFVSLLSVAEVFISQIVVCKTHGFVFT